MFFNRFSVELDDTGPIKKILLCFDFTGVAKPTINGYVNGNLVAKSEKTKSGAVVLLESEFPEFFMQGAYLQVYLTNTQTHQELKSEVLSFFVIWKSDTKNGWNPRPITYISDSEWNKSMILPPVAQSKGKLYHFKYFGTKRPFVLLSSLKNRSYPLEKSEVIYAPTDALNELFESTIEESWKFVLEHPNQAVSIVSDGTAWLVVNNYEGTFTSIGKGSLPESIVREEKPSHFLNYYWNTEAKNTIQIGSLRQNALKFLHIQRFLPDSGILRVYFPEGVGVEGVDCSGGEVCYLSISLSNKGLLSNSASFVLSYFNKRVYILSWFDGAGFRTAEFPKGEVSQIESSLTITKGEIPFQLPPLDLEKQETKFYILKHRGEGTFSLASAKKDDMTIYTSKNDLRDCITYSRPLKRFCFWILYYCDHQMGGQPMAIFMNKYYEGL